MTWYIGCTASAVHISRATSSSHDRPATAGVTIVEIAVSLTILALVMAGVIAVLIQSRRLTEGSIYQNSATAIVQGYIEQMKNMELSDLPYYSGTTLVAGNGTSADANLSYYKYTSNTLFAGPQSGCGANNDVSTQLDESTRDPLFISSGDPPSLSSITLGTDAPSGVIDNVKLIDINQTPSDNSDDLQIRIWLWIKDLTGGSGSATTVRSITIIYQTRFKDGGRFRYSIGTVRTIRSDVPTF